MGSGKKSYSKTVSSRWSVFGLVLLSLFLAHLARCTDGSCLVPCQNSGTCLADNTTCNCSTGFAGSACQYLVGNCSSVPCHNGGICQNWTETDSVTNMTTTVFNCTCQGFYGYTCDTYMCTNDTCQNNGTCLPSSGPSNYTCSCKPGYYGHDCEHPSLCNQTVSPCGANANCTDLPDGSYNCTCPPGFNGTNCSSNINECQSMPCQNSGSCIDGINNYTCDCSQIDYNGTNCEQHIDDCLNNQCQHSSTCEDRVRNYTCTCLPGYTGHFCDINIDDCFPNPCSNGGTCLDEINGYLCMCPSGYNASTCSQCVLHQPCQNGGTCGDVADHGFTCQCASTYVGTVCNLTDPCQPTSPCKNGTCYYVIDATESNVTSHCNCSFGYTGTHCEIAPSPPVPPSEVPVALIIGICVGVGGGIILIVIIVVLVRIALKKRATEGVYRPSQQEALGPQVSIDSVLKRPPEERLI